MIASIWLEDPIVPETAEMLITDNERYQDVVKAYTAKYAKASGLADSEL